MRVVKIVFLAIVAVVLILVALANAQAVTLRLLPETMGNFMGLTWAVTLPMFVVILGAVVIGILIGFVVVYARERKHRTAARHERREREGLEREVTKMRSTGETRSDRSGDDIVALIDNKPAPTKRAS